MVAEITVLLIQSFVVPIITELVKMALKKLSSSKELKELEAGLGEINSMVDRETRSLRRNPKVVMGSLRRLKGAAEATESILGDSRATGIAMVCSIDYLSGKTQLLPQGSEGILPSLRLIVQGMESDLQKANVEATDPVRQTLRRVVESAASLRRPAAEEHSNEGKSLCEPVLSKPAEQRYEGKSLLKPAEESLEGKSLRKPVLRKPEQLLERKSLCKPVLSKPEQLLEGKSLRKPVLSKLEQLLDEKSLHKPVLSKPAEEPLEGKSLRERKSHCKAVTSKPMEELSEEKSLRR
ncbi:hypothetical protein ACQ4PT_023774 [Festuca glaucescens]